MIGPARREPVEDAARVAPAASAGYREGPSRAALVFDGRHAEGVWILVG